jgi:large subunit ribosomal protein L21
VFICGSLSSQARKVANQKPARRTDHPARDEKETHPQNSTDRPCRLDRSLQVAILARLETDLGKSMYAIIEDSGTQYKVSTGETILIDRPLEDHQKFVDAKTLKFEKVLLVAGEGSPKIGTPAVKGATVEAEVIRSFKDDKVIIVKYNRRKRYHRKYGHRQKYLEVKISAIKI